MTKITNEKMPGLEFEIWDFEFVILLYHAFMQSF